MTTPEQHARSNTSLTPIAIHSTPTSHAAPVSTHPKLRYPYPLALLAILDLFYTLHHASKHRAAPHLIGLSIIRAGVLIIGLGSSRLWRQRGVWLGLASGISVGAVVWEWCVGQLRKSETGEADVQSRAHASFLGTTILISTIEYLCFLVLLRLSPAPGLSLRDSIQSPTGYSFRTSATPPSQSQDSESDPEMGFTDPEDDDVSSVSDSSIIDLPPPLSPSRIVPPHSLSMNGGLNLAALDDTPVVGHLVRRTRSARFLGRSWGSRVGPEDDDDDQGEGEELGRTAQNRGTREEDYGTFGQA
ncbi:hypothetical protein BCR39DRAFT_518285 [Naematelia encephala]|uniref:Uncharacterized protein n=1 Tax=Naematelia encephala TaxID=71784 RepID=A0A1Y2BGX7_9TREE|nr:hypothetical protein BCR39DRAFT_518285 [Naematelia encephala]